MSEHKNLNIINVPYGFGWTHREKDGSVSGSTYTIDHYLELADKKLQIARNNEAVMREAIKRAKAMCEVLGFDTQSVGAENGIWLDLKKALDKLEEW